MFYSLGELLGDVACWAGGAGGAASLASHEVADFCEQLFGGWGWCFFFNAQTTLVHLVELIDWRNDEEVNNTSDDQEVDSSGDDCTEVNEGGFIVGDLEAKTCHISRAEGVDDWLDEESVSAVTIAVKAPPMMTPTAKSMTLPRMMKSLKP